MVNETPCATRASALVNARQASAFSLLLVLAVLAPFSQAAKAPTEDILWYHEIAGAEPVSPPANPSVVSVTLGGPRA